MTIRNRAIHWMAAALCLTATGCDQGNGHPLNSGNNVNNVNNVNNSTPCEGVTCSEHGTCTVVEAAARCTCDPGWHEEGLACLADVPAGCGGPEPYLEPADRLYMAPDGDDGAAGSLEEPLRTLEEAAGRLLYGGTIIVRGGVYPAEQWFDLSGTAENLLVIRAAEGEVPVFDGATVTGEWSSVLAFGAVQNVVIDGLEIRNCTAANCAGISADRVLNLTVRNCHIHHVQSSGARFFGSVLRLEGNYIHDAALTNENNTDYPDGGWPTCMGTTPDRDLPEDPWTDDVIIRDNTVEDCWGEGIGVWYGSNVLIEGNTVINPFNVGIYMDNSFNVRVLRNFVRISRGMYGRSGSGITMATEPYDFWGLSTAPARQIDIVNNVVVGGGGIGWWSSDEATDANTYEGIRVLHNTIVATTGGAIGFDAVGEGRPAPSACMAVNNIFVEAGSGGFDDPSAWTMADNAWLNQPVPDWAGETDVSVSFVVDPVTSALDVQAWVGQVGTGAPDTGIVDDYLCVPRDLAQPGRGAFEK
ncbi:right-handed parallel beta-helix repeat-containing protein [Myxococcota bacterium]|nr:right-handed parallel beta-helix repeat-containing protein [Myxococcota bacterium]MBU1509956.1 right-handed parallel beta-helix repeat-containing protein [Myxococcota bacterium]